MPINKSKLNQVYFYFFALLIIYLPFQRLLEQILLYRGLSESLVFWATHFYEPLIIIVLLLNCYVAVRNIIIKKRNLWIVIISLVLIALSAVSIFVLSPSISRGIEGGRFTIFFLLAFLAAYFSNLDSKQSYKLINIYLVMAGIFALWGIAERFLPINYLMNLGLISPDSAFGYGTHKVVTIYQSVTGVGGPNQLASYLLPAIFIALAQISKFKNVSHPELVSGFQQYNNTTMKQSTESSHFVRTIYYVVPIISIATIILTFSRSAWVGLYLGLTIAALILIKNLWFKIISVIILIALAAGVGFYYFNRPNDILTHGASDAGHKSAYQLSKGEIKNRLSQPTLLLFGSGIGTAGPAALKYGDGFVSESWYLQLVLELGAVYMLLWLALILLLLIQLYKQNKGLFLALVSVSTAAIFLHTFADNPAMSITLFLLIGVCLQNRD